MNNSPVETSWTIHPLRAKSAPGRNHPSRAANTYEDRFEIFFAGFSDTASLEPFPAVGA